MSSTKRKLFCTVFVDILLLSVIEHGKFGVSLCPRFSHRSLPQPGVERDYLGHEPGPVILTPA